MDSVKGVLTGTLKKTDSKEFLDFVNYVFTLFVPKRGGLMDVATTGAYFKILYGHFKITSIFMEFLEVSTLKLQIECQNLQRTYK